MRVKYEIHNSFTLRNNIIPMTIGIQSEEIQSRYTRPTISNKKKTHTQMFLLIKQQFTIIN